MPNKTLHTNRRPALGFGLSYGLLRVGRPYRVIVRAAVGELGRWALALQGNIQIGTFYGFCLMK